MKDKRKLSIRKILYNNTLLKIVSILIAVILWAYIIIIIDAPTDRTFRDVTINTVNEQILSDNGYSIEKLSVTMVTVKIEGSRKVIAKFDSDNINAVLDFSEINTAKLASEGVITANLKVQSEFGEVVSFTPSAIDVYVEPTKYKDIDVRFKSSGKLIDGYIQGDIKLSQDKVRIFGAQKNIDAVTHAEVSYDYMNTKFESYDVGRLTETCPVELLSSNGALSEKESRWIWNNSSEITVSCPIYKMVSAVVVPNTTDIPAWSLKCTPSEVKVYGDNDKIDEYATIETEPINKTMIENSSEVSVKLSLPSWMKVADNVSEVIVSADSSK